MPSVSDLAREHAGLDHQRTQHLQRLVRSWGLLADLSFSDLLLFANVAAQPVPGKVVLLGHVRPTTAQTIYRTDLVGSILDAADRPVVQKAFATGRMAEGVVTVAGPSEPVHVIAVPVRWRGEILAVLTRESLPPLARPASDLERTYTEVFVRFARMIEAGTYPFPGDWDDQYMAPRVGDGAIVLDAAGRVEYNSPNAVSALHRMGVHVNAEGFTLGELGLDDDVVRSAFASRSPVIVEFERQPDITVVLDCIPLLDDSLVSGAIVLLRDISELRRRDRLLLSKDATIREIHHRVKNNLQTISSLLRLQARRLASKEARDAVEESVRRIASIAVVHETLAHAIGDEAPFTEVVRPLVRMVEEGLSSPERPVRFHLTGDAGVLPAEVTTPLAVVVTELLQNAVEHAYPGDRADPGHVQVELGRDGGTVRVRIIDDGAGVAEDFSLDRDAGLGLTIVRTFVESDLGGTIEMRRRSGATGTFVELQIPVRGRAGR
jgi:two-component system, sensor histidine kinase PdtaS